MKFITVVAIAVMITALALVPGCKKDGGSDPVSYVDGYTVNLTEGKGTTYAGDFFPIREGYVCNYSGYASMKTTLTIPGYSPYESTTNEPAIGMLKVLAIRTIPLPSGAIPLYPVVDMTEMSGQVVDDTSRFFMKDTQAVYIKALKLASGKYMGVDNPVFIKSRLVVGDAWETAPRLDMTKLLQNEAPGSGVASTITMNARAKFFVVGMENIALPIGTRSAMRLEQANDITMNGTVVAEGVTCGLTMTAQLAVVYHLIADTGIVHQNVTGPLDMNLTAEGQTLNIKIEINQCELKLTSLNQGNSKNIISHGTKHRGFAQPPVSFSTQAQEKMWRIAQTIARTLTKKLSVQ
jgi:hypothetical protein